MGKFAVVVRSPGIERGMGCETGAVDGQMVLLVGS